MELTPPEPKDPLLSQLCPQPRAHRIRQKSVDRSTLAGPALIHDLAGVALSLASEQKFRPVETLENLGGRGGGGANMRAFLGYMICTHKSRNGSKLTVCSLLSATRNRKARSLLPPIRGGSSSREPNVPPLRQNGHEIDVPFETHRAACQLQQPLWGICRCVPRPQVVCMCLFMRYRQLNPKARPCQCRANLACACSILGNMPRFRFTCRANQCLLGTLGTFGSETSNMTPDS